MASIQQRRDRYYVRWREGGRGTREQVRVFRTEAEAQAFKVEAENRLAIRRKFGPDWGRSDYFERHPEHDIFGGYLMGLDGMRRACWARAAGG